MKSISWIESTFTYLTIFLLCIKVSFVSCYWKCDDGAEEVYILEGKLVRVERYSQREVTVIGCAQDSLIKSAKKFDPVKVLTINVTDLILKDLIWPYFPENLPYFTSLTRVTPRGNWGDCPRLSHLMMTEMNWTLASPNWLSNCSQLHKIELYNIKSSTVLALLASTPAVRSLVLGFEINLDSHRVAYDSIEEVHLLSPEVRRDTYWAEVSSALTFQLAQLPDLEYLVVTDITYFDLCASVNSSSPVTFRSLRRLRMSGTNTSRLCFKEFRAAPHLKEIRIRSPEMQLQFGELLSVRAPELHVALDRSLILSFQFTRDDYLMLTEENKRGFVVIHTDMQVPLDNCGCDQWLWLLRALQEGLVKMTSGIVCSDGRRPTDFDCDWLECERIHYGKECVYCRTIYNMTGADCRDAGLRALPTEVLSLTNVYILIARNNNITRLPETIPDTMMVLDLSRNDIFRRTTVDEMDKLFSKPHAVYLAGNPIDCSCENQPLLLELQRYRNRIQDYTQLACTNTSRLVDLNIAELCSAQDREANLKLIAMTTVGIVIVTLVIGATRYYSQPIKIFLFARGWCLCWLREEELDADRHYDVFLSFCHADADLVLEQMLPTLDQEYSVCVHVRDWCPGLMIPTQIRMSVASSKRTLVVLSKAFTKSLWGLLEFQTAYASSMSERRNRVVMVILDDVLESSELPVELRTYVSFNTYVKWGDPWFWSKMRYALPHRPSPHTPLIPSPHYHHSSAEQSVELRAIQYYVQEPEVDFGQAQYGDPNCS